MTYALALIIIGVALMHAFWAWADKSGRERKEEGKPNFLRPIIIVVVSVMAAIILWGMLTGN